ncbi:DinB family protein [Brevibacillus panacihumi]|uniref:DinB family protein n=1 Tax=Brevibacillus panacihumi TaxID=497735 RepID=A0A3M8CW86_9BACL|nr:DinB family protein [Brevibacillus panacihumi]RNB80060.1 DinB family protein [Brevibacillus panacihumi]
MSSAILSSGKTIRSVLLHRAQMIPEELYDVQPVPFNNTIKWNLGHIAVVQNSILALCSLDVIKLPDSYEELFKMGTKPADWTITPPTKDELLAVLAEQLNKLSELSPESLEGALPKPIEMGPMRFETVAELCNFAFIHEAMHAGTISSLVKVINHNA